MRRGPSPTTSIVREASPPTVTVAAAVLAAHAVLRFGGLWQPALVPLSMVLVWPLPWLLLDRDGRRRMGIRRPDRRGWVGVAGLSGLVGLAACAVVAWLVFGTGDSSWLMRHRQMLELVAATLPGRLDAATTFWLVTLPSLILRPLGEEILFRGFLLEAGTRRWGSRAGLILQAVAFAAVQLARYGLAPYDPALLALWLPSMLVLGLVLGWLARRYRSLAPPILAHAAFNLALSWTVLRLLDALGTR